MACLAIIPGLNFTYSGHGGPAWFVLPFVFPVALIRLYRAVRAAPPELRPAIRRFAFSSVVAYAPLSYLASFWGAHSIHRTFGLEVTPLGLWALFTMPFGLLIFVQAH